MGGLLDLPQQQGRGLLSLPGSRSYGGMTLTPTPTDGGWGTNVGFDPETWARMRQMFGPNWIFAPGGPAAHLFQQGQ